MKPALLDPRNDLVFKLLFAKSFPLLTDLINAVRTNEVPITVIDVLNPHIAAEEINGKYIVLDILAKDSFGHLFNVEMQMSRREEWGARSMMYLSKTLSTQLKAGIDYAELKPVIGIHLLAYDLFPEQAQAFWCFEMRDRANPGVRLGSELQLYLVELAKADKLATYASPNHASGDVTALAAWIKYFQHCKEPCIMNQIDYPPVQEAMSQLAALSADDEARRLADVRERALMTERTEIRAAELRGANQAIEKIVKALIQSGMTEAQARAIVDLRDK